MKLFPLTAIAAAAAIGLASESYAAQVLATYTFEGTPTSSTYSADVGTGTGTANGVTVSSTTVAGNASAKSWSSNAWDVGDSYQFTTSSTGYKDLTVSFDTTGSNTGPKSFDFQYSTNGTSFTKFASYTLTNDNWSSNTANAPKTASQHSYDLSSITALNNLSTIYFRLTDASTTAINGTTVVVGGTSRVDNFSIVAANQVPEPAALGLLGLAGMGALRRRRK